MNRSHKIDFFPPGSKLNGIVEQNYDKDVVPNFVAMPNYLISNSSDYYDTIKESLSFKSDYENVNDILKRIKCYVKPKHSYDWKFQSLAYFYDINKAYFNSTIPKILDLVFKIEQMPMIHFLLPKSNALTLSQEQIGTLLANAFFCTFPMRHSQHSNHSAFKSHQMILPSINFSSLFENIQVDTQFEKLKCIFHYFNRICQSGFFESNGCVTYSLHNLTDNINWAKCYTSLSSLIVNETEKIEDQSGHLQVDFANKKVGGGILGRGCLQEEIRFLICPELIAARLFTPQLSNNEVLIVTGCERFSNYCGYANTFQHTGDFQDKTERDSCGRRMTQVVMMDALKFDSSADQYKLNNIKRELNKAFCAFRDYRINVMTKPAPVATGNWGCGDFGGNKQFKFLIQLCSASFAGRGVKYLTYGDESLAKKIRTAHSILTRHGFTVGDVYSLLVNHESYLRSRTERLDILDYIIETFGQE